MIRCLASGWRNRIRGSGIALVAAAAFVSAAAHAYPWMIRHDYTGCAVCHTDPSGSGLLTPYGRAQGELLLRTPYSSPPAGQEREPGRLANFLWGALDSAQIPEWLLLGGSFRGAFVFTKVPDRPWDRRYIQMEADLYAAVNIHHFRADVSVGVLPEGGLPAAITSSNTWNLISREHWVGYEFGRDQAFLLRAGRINLPFGLRNIEHTSYVRRNTRTDLNSYQQHGVALAYSGEKWRGELMAIAGNFQISPDYRERGYAGYVELSLTHRAAVGLSSLVTHANKDVDLKVENLRQTHGVFARYAPFRTLVLLAEGDLLAQSPSGASAYLGYVGFLQADFEFFQGVHLFPMVEILRRDTHGAGPSYGAWLSPDWFFAPHSDLRLDLFVRREAEVRAVTTSVGFLVMLHFYL